jgi:uracil-DNA glycosylase family 4
MNEHLAWDALNNEIVHCRACPRLVVWREEVARQKRRAYREWDYWGKPVPGFGDPHARLLIVGLAPGAHGSNRTGRMFTGDASGDFLYAALYRAGFASQPYASHRLDGLEMRDAFITAVCRCVPPKNRPLPEEITACRPFLLRELALLRQVRGIVALGRVAFDQIAGIYRAQRNELSHLTFQHGALYSLGENHPWILASYHPSRQNTQTGRLTAAMFDAVWKRAKIELANA